MLRGSNPQTCSGGRNGINVKTVGVDFNMIASPGVVLASPSFASAQLNRGDLVVAVDFDDPQLRVFRFRRRFRSVGTRSTED